MYHFILYPSTLYINSVLSSIYLILILIPYSLSFQLLVVWLKKQNYSLARSLLFLVKVKNLMKMICLWWRDGFLHINVLDGLLENANIDQLPHIIQTSILTEYLTNKTSFDQAGDKQVFMFPLLVCVCLIPVPVFRKCISTKFNS